LAAKTIAAAAATALRPLSIEPSERYESPCRISNSPVPPTLSRQKPVFSGKSFRNESQNPRHDVGFGNPQRTQYNQDALDQQEKSEKYYEALSRFAR
jgi:hypothetical protein